MKIDSLELEKVEKEEIFQEAVANFLVCDLEKQVDSQKKSELKEKTCEAHAGMWG